MDDKLHIVYATDAGYLMPTKVAAASAVLWASEPQKIVIHILDCGLTDREWGGFESSLRKHCGEQFGLVRHQVDMAAYGDFKQWHCSRGIYARLDIPNILADLDWCVYADGDTLFTDNPLKLMDVWNDCFALVGHLDGFNMSQPKWFAENGFHFDPEHYVCAGFILMNLRWFRREGAVCKCFEMLRRYPEIPYNDQDVLNIVCDGKIGLLPNAWGCSPTTLGDEVSCIHYTYDKPWKKSPYKYFAFTGYMLVWIRFARQYLDLPLGQISDYGLMPFVWGYVKTVLSPYLFGILNRLPYFKGRYSRVLASVWSEERIRNCLPPQSRKVKSVCFLTGGLDPSPVGGFKVMYEYANRLAAAGWRVSIVYPYCGRGDTFPRHLFKYHIHALNFLRGYPKHGKGAKVGGAWFPLDERVRKVYVFQNSPGVAKMFPNGTKFIATYITTVDDLNRFDVPAADKFNFIQDYEAWFGYSTDYVDATYRYPMTKIAISEWLCEKVCKAGSEAVYIPNGLDFVYFKMTNPTEGRRRTEVAMLWHCDERKRTEDAVAALKIVREKHPDLHVTAFGVPDKPADLPDWITYHQRPDRETHNAIYNNAAIFVASSEQEGWGLTPCEAMQCGAAVACTDIGGYRSFATDGETALMSPARDVAALAANVNRLIEDDALRVKIAKTGHANIQQFTWERSFARFKMILE